MTACDERVRLRGEGEREREREREKEREREGREGERERIIGTTRSAKQTCCNKKVALQSESGES